ncbi:MAG TPA: M28 family peptidase [Gemmatimonadales bacterium]|nr:M28 family peptidase [Gemmatimonadales bacterium]
MSLRRVLIVFALAGAAAGSLAAQATTAAISAQDLRRRLFALADDSMGGRRSGSIGDFKAAEYVAAEFRRLGLQPAGEAGTWFQTVPFFIAQPAGTALAAGDAALTWGTDFVLAGRPLPLVQLRGAMAVYGGVVSDSATWLPAGQAGGKVVVLDVRPGADGKRQLVRGLTRIATNARFTGAAVVAVVEMDLLAPEVLYLIAGERLTADTSRGSRQPAIALITPHAAELLLGAPPERVAAGAAGRPVQGDLGVRFAPVPYAARNVLGVLPGSDRAVRGEYVALSAHNDHVGFDHQALDHDSVRAYNRVIRPMGADSPDHPASAEEQARVQQLLDSLRRVNPARRDSIRNGADDDGSGTVAILEIAEALAAVPAAQRPKRSLLFISHTGEEEGLVGSAWFTDHPTVPVDSIVGEFDEDMVGRGTATDLPGGGPGYLEVIGAKRLSVEFGDLLEAANAALPHPFTFNYAYDVPGHPLQYYCRADHYSYARYGIPSVSLSRGEHLDYHQITDEAQYIDYEDLARVATLVRDAAVRVANLDHRPKLDHQKGDPHAPCVQ